MTMTSQYPPPPGTEPYGYPQQPPCPGHAAPPPGNRKRPPARVIIPACTGLTGLLIGIAIGAASGSSPTTSATASRHAANPAASDVAAPASSRAAHVGSWISLRGQDEGERVDVQLVHVYQEATPADDWSQPASGKHIVAVEWRIRNSGTATYSDSIDNSGTVIDKAGRSFSATSDNETQCTDFPGSVKIPPGASRIGCTAFEVPIGDAAAQVQFTPDSGYADSTGQWAARR
jgi:hypothetical protein